MEISQLINIGVRNTYSMVAIENQGCVSDSLMNEYVPFFSAFHADFKRVGSVRYSIYQTPPSHVGAGSTNKIASFKRALECYATSLTYLKGEHKYEVIKNCIFTREEGQRDKMLYCLAIKTDYLLGSLGSSDRPDFNSLDYTKLIILLDRDFTEAPDRRLMYNFLKREVIQPLLDLGIDMVITNSVNRWCFKDSSSPVNFNTMSEMREFLNNLSNNIIDGITGRERPAEIEPASEPESLSDSEAARIFDELRRAEGISESGDDWEVEGELDNETSRELDRVELSIAIEAELQAARNRTDYLEENRELALGREDMATEERGGVPEGVDRGVDQFTTPGISGDTFNIRFSEDWLRNREILDPPNSRAGFEQYAAGIDPFNNSTSTPDRIYITEETGEVDQYGQRVRRVRQVQPNLTGGIDISYGARGREGFGFHTDPAAIQREPIIQYSGRPSSDPFLDYRGQGNPPTTPDNRRMFERFEVREERQELSREDLWSLPGRETQSSEETQERDESANPLEDDGLPY